jgi:hypothetical protein
MTIFYVQTLFYPSWEPFRIRDARQIVKLVVSRGGVLMCHMVDVVESGRTSSGFWYHCCTFPTEQGASAVLNEMKHGRQVMKTRMLVHEEEQEECCLDIGGWDFLAADFENYKYSLAPGMSSQYISIIDSHLQRQQRTDDADVVSY